MDSPAVLRELEIMMPPWLITATSTVPAPMSTSIPPRALMTFIPAPIAAAMGSSHKSTVEAPASKIASSTARRSDSLAPKGILARILGRRKVEVSSPPSRKVPTRSEACSMLAMVPPRMGLIADMLAGVLPIMRLASAPTASTSFFLFSIEMTEGARRTMPSLPRQKRV